MRTSRPACKQLVVLLYDCLHYCITAAATVVAFKDQSRSTVASHDCAGYKSACYSLEAKSRDISGVLSEDSKCTLSSLADTHDVCKLAGKETVDIGIARGAVGAGAPLGRRKKIF